MYFIKDIFLHNEPYLKNRFYTFVVLKYDSVASEVFYQTEAHEY